MIGPIDQYLLELRHELLQAVTPKILGAQTPGETTDKLREYVDQTVNEVGQHLQDRSYQISLETSPPDAAPHKAIAEFGPPKKLALALAEKRKRVLSAKAHLVAELGFLLVALVYYSVIGGAVDTAAHGGQLSWRWVFAASGLEGPGAGLGIAMTLMGSRLRYKFQYLYLVLGGLWRSALGILFIALFADANRLNPEKTPYIRQEWVQLAILLAIYWIGVFIYRRGQAHLRLRAEMRP